MHRLRMSLRIGGLMLMLALVLQQGQAAPVASPDPGVDSRPDIIEIIAPAQNAQETLDSLNLGEPNAEQSERNKRTIGILRQLFPTLSQIVDQKIQQIVSFLFRTVGRSLLSGALGGGGGQAGGGGGGTRASSTASAGGKISISLPTYGPDGESDDDDDSSEEEEDSKSSSSVTVASRVSTEQQPAEPTQATSAVNGEENLLAGAESQQNEVRVQFDDSEAEKKTDNADQELAASGGNGADNEDLSLDDVDADSSDENRNKRFLSFGFGGGDQGGSSGGSGGGSGNFLFDIIRRPAESMARAAGQAFRVLTGTDSIGLGITASHTATKLVAGSGGTEQSDEASSAPLDGEAGKADGYTEGIPGPVTRLFIIANRGISNLIQDLILRLAQTSERIVNFKARLITSII